MSIDLADSPPPTLPPEKVPWSARILRVVRDWGVPLLLALALAHLVGRLRAPELPPEAPPFNLVNLDGGEVSLESLRGRTVVLNFWATWCGPCRAEIPGFRSFSEDHPDISVLGIAVDGSPEDLRAARKRLGITYPVLVADKPTLSAYQVETLPTTVIVGPDGQVKVAHVGIMTQPQLEMAVW
jgi:thiol-disulfide isomerase/thioredoxin